MSKQSGSLSLYFSPMASFPEPQAGLVISYAYLWSDEAEQGHVEGRKDRPCAIVVALENPEPKPRKQVAVVPIMHTSPKDPGEFFSANKNEAHS